MAALDFPVPTADGQLFSAPNGIVYRWLASAGLWVAYATGNNTAIINSTPPANPAAGQLWWSPDLGQMFIWYTDVDSSQWVPTNPSTQAQAGVDFFAITGNLSLPVGTATILVAPTVVSGNSGGWYNTSNGRFTPPAGRYRFSAAYSGYGPSGTSFDVTFLKNGVQVGQSPSAMASAINTYVECVNDLNADANGTDYFTVQLIASNGATSGSAWFGAFALPRSV